MDRKVWIVLQAVACIGRGLMTLVYQQIGWPAMVAMLLLLAPTKREFERYGLARRTLDQTIQALESLRTASLLQQ